MEQLSLGVKNKDLSCEIIFLSKKGQIRNIEKLSGSSSKLHIIFMAYPNIIMAKFYKETNKIQYSLHSFLEKIVLCQPLTF